VDPRSIAGIVENSMTLRLRQIMSGVDAMLSTIAITSEASNKAFAIINEKFEESWRSQHAMNAQIDDSLNIQQSQLMKLIDGMKVCNAQMVKHSEWMDHMEILFAEVDRQLPDLARFVEACTSVGTEVDAVGSNLTKIREQAELAATVMNLHLDSMEETFKDSFRALNVDDISAKLTLLEGTLMALFTEVENTLENMTSTTPTPLDMVPDENKMQEAIPNPSKDQGITASGSAAVEDEKPPNCFPMVTSFLCRPSSSFPAGNRYPHPRDYRIPPAYDAHQAHADETYLADGNCQAYDSRGHIHQSQRSTYGRTLGL
jgi:hypothetical protein